MFYFVTVMGLLVAAGYGFFMALKCNSHLEKEGVKDI